MQTNAQEVSITSPYSGLVFAAKVWGNTSAEVRIIALHGWMDNAATWDHLLPVIFNPESQPPFCFVCLDLAGHGKSEHRPGRLPYSLVDHVPDVISIADHFGWERFSVLGHSMGAAIATVIAGVFPNRINHLIAVEGFGPWVHTEDFGEQLRASMETNKVVFSKGPNVYPNLESAIDRWAQSQPEMKRESLKTLVSRATKEVDGGVQFCHDVRLRAQSHMRMIEPQVVQVLRGIKCPIMVILGEKGLAFTDNPLKRDYAGRKELVGNLLKKELIVSGAHHPHLDNPESMAQEIVAFLQAKYSTQEQQTQ